MIWRQAQVLIQIERVDAAQVQAVLTMHARQFSIQLHWRAARRQAKHQIRLAPNGLGDQVGRDAHGISRRGLDDDFHGCASERRAVNSET